MPYDEITEYKTATAQTTEELDASVNRLIQEGYQPSGGPYYVATKNQDGFVPVSQAMMKEAAKAKNGICLNQILRQNQPRPKHSTTGPHRSEIVLK